MYFQNHLGSGENPFCICTKKTKEADHMFLSTCLMVTLGISHKSLMGAAIEFDWVAAYISLARLSLWSQVHCFVKCLSMDGEHPFQTLISLCDLDFSLSKSSVWSFCVPVTLHRTGSTYPFLNIMPNRSEALCLLCNF